MSEGPNGAGSSGLLSVILMDTQGAQGSLMGPVMTFSWVENPV
ncbi:MAG: hypothetical protein ACO3A2_01370 [Bdellovibrionia bacterium]